MIGKLFPTVASIMSVFTKMIEQLEKVQARQNVKILEGAEKIQKIQAKVSLATEEHKAAELAIKRLKALTDE